jgi:hypothetical protein
MQYALVPRDTVALPRGSARFWPTKKGNVSRNEKGAERHHPKSQHRKETQNSEEDQQKSDG